MTHAKKKSVKQKEPTWREVAAHFVGHDFAHDPAHAPQDCYDKFKDQQNRRREEWMEQSWAREADYRVRLLEDVSRDMWAALTDFIANRKAPVDR